MSETRQFWAMVREQRLRTRPQGCVASPGEKESGFCEVSLRVGEVEEGQWEL